LSSVARVVIIIFGVALLGAVGYVAWFAITHGLWNSILSNTSMLEGDIMSMITQAEKNAEALGAIISKKFFDMENAASDAYKTVATTLVSAANTVKSAGNDTISKIKTEGDSAISNINNTFKNVGSTVQTTAVDTIGKIQDTSKAAIIQVQSAFNTVQSTLIDTSKAITTSSQGIIDSAKKSSMDSYTTILQTANISYKSIQDTSTGAVKTSGSGSFTKVRQGFQNEGSSSDEASQIKGIGDKAMNEINNISLTVIAKIKDASTQLAEQIAEEAAAAAEAAEAAAGSATVKEAFQNAGADTPTTPLMDTLFFNLQPLSIKDTGFLGPYPKGSYKEEIATANALKAGCRFLTLQVDYTDVKMNLSLYEVPGVPTLLIRSPDGTLLSKNSGSINSVAQTIAEMAFNPIVPQNTLPVILYIHVVRAPNALTAPDEYLDFLSQIAEALNPLAPFHLGLSPQGNFTRQKMAEELLTMPLRSLEGQIIVMSNADTSMFRRTKANKNKYPPAKDLDFWVNVQVYLDDEGDLNGITQLADPSVQPAAVLVSLQRVLLMNSMNKDAFAKKGKRRYVIAMGDRTKNPTPTELGVALNSLGINVIPIDIFTDTDRNTLLLSNEYSNKTFRPKPDTLQLAL